ncbi:MAG: transrane and repeat-containing protein, partial [Flavipsychrobacter sp.]|nr:transrane and repeat-containing protein [Flavipsychrobacter sp.]
MPGNKKKNIAATQPAKAKPADNGPVKESSFQIPLWAPLVVILITALIYSHGLQNEFTLYDDTYYVTENPQLADFTLNSIKVIFTSFCYFLYLPLTILVYLFEYHLFGLDPLPYHLLQLAIHLINTWLVFRLTEKLSGHRLT